ncbi:hypothetical protein QAD02_013373 [Eretmocerus hayati]|uniref:Uncharacterized protein n=1 Tax=Eretmocerus hayati TaxID=131215 RepID=A0ACC2P2D3_9HYME|nr:hypothetical protein QAD02_013373 [Eretmocerus hayati]
MQGQILATRHKSVDVDGKTLVPGTVIVTGTDKSFGEPQFGKLGRIFKIGTKISLVTSTLRNSSFESDYHAYRVMDNDEPDKAMDIEDIYELLPCVYVTKYDE